MIFKFNKTGFCQFHFHCEKKRMKTKFVMKSKIAKKQTGKRDNFKSLEITLTIKAQITFTPKP